MFLTLTNYLLIEIFWKILLELFVFYFWKFCVSNIPPESNLQGRPKSGIGGGW